MDSGPLQIRRLLRLSAVAGALALAAAGVGACGGDDDSQDSGSGAQTQAEPSADGTTGGAGPKPKPDGGPALTGDVEEARKGSVAVDDVYESFGAAVEAGIAKTSVSAGNTLEAAEDNESLMHVCDLMSEAAQRQTIVYAERSAGLAGIDWTCEKATGLLLRRAKQTGGLKRSLRARIVRVDADGDRATASIRFGGKGPISTVPLVQEDGEWKLAASPSGDRDGK